MIAICLTNFKTGSQILQIETPLSPSKCKCLRCEDVFKKVTRAEYEEFKVPNGPSLCGDCFHAQLIIETDLWTQEMRRNHGPAWDGFPTRKRVNFKRPIKLLSSSSSSASASIAAVASSDSISKGYFCFICKLFADNYDYRCWKSRIRKWKSFHSNCI